MKVQLTQWLGALIFFFSVSAVSLGQPNSGSGGMEGHPMEGRPMMPGMDHPMDSPGPHEMKKSYQGYMMRPHNAAIHFLEMKDILGLTDKQIADLKTLRDTYRAENSLNEAKLRNSEQELRELLEEDTINLEKAEAKIKEIGALEGPLWSGFVKQLAKVKTIVSKDQMKKLHEMRRPNPMKGME